jgi:hypothetical protein
MTQRYAAVEGQGVTCRTERILHPGRHERALALEVLETAYDRGVDKYTVLRGIAQAAAGVTSTGPIGVCTYHPTDGLPDFGTSYFERAEERYISIFAEGARPLPLVMLPRPSCRASVT